MQDNTHSSSTPKIVGALALGVVVVVGAYVFFTKGSDDIKSSSASTTPISSNTTPQSTTSTSLPSASSQSATNSATSSSGYKDGTYSATANYRVPHGSNSITVSLIIKDGMITKVTTNDDYSDRESGYYIDDFKSSISSAVEGKKLGNVSLSRVGGASLTTEAFDQAVTQISSQAQA